jgi:4-amino-4-deoxy-L-arabinose transferase-like glycosyltransferase
LFGLSEFSLRFPSLIFSVASIPCLFLLGKKIFNRRVGLYGALVMSLSSFHLWYAQEARPYSLSVLLSILSTYYLYRFIKEGKIKLGLVYVLFSVLGLYANITYYHLFLIPIQFLAVAVFIKKKFFLKLIFFLSLIFCFFALRLDLFISKLLYVKVGFWIPEPTLKSLIFTLENFNLGYSASCGLYWFSDLIALIILMLGLSVLQEKEEYRRNYVFLILLSFLPLFLAYVFSKNIFSIYLDRGLIIFSPYYYLLLGVGLNYLKNKWLKIIVFCVFLVVLLINLPNYYQNLMPVGVEHHFGVIPRKPYQPALRFIEDNFKAGDMIVHTNSSTQEAFKFYCRNKKIAQIFLFAPKMIDSNWDRPYVPGLGILRVEDLTVVNPKRIWVVSCDWQRGNELDENSQAVNSEMGKMYKLDLRLEFDGLWVYRYVKT